MQRWEYIWLALADKTYLTSDGREWEDAGIATVLNELGGDGWEMTGNTYNRPNERSPAELSRFYFKRPIED
jgi:hypothetical protein